MCIHFKVGSVKLPKLLECVREVTWGAVSFANQDVLYKELTLGCYWVKAKILMHIIQMNE